MLIKSDVVLFHTVMKVRYGKSSRGKYEVLGAHVKLNLEHWHVT